MQSILSAPHFRDEAAAFAYLEGLIWPNGVVCARCGTVGGRIYDLSKVRGKPSARNPEGPIRHGLKKCGGCRYQFTARVGTVFEHGRMPLHKMLLAVYLISSSKKGISSHQLHRLLGITYRSAWFLSHRIREAMRSGDASLLGSGGGLVESDETFIGREPGRKLKPGYAHKLKVVSLVDRTSGGARSFVVDSLQAHDLVPVIMQNVSLKARLMTDEAKHYAVLGRRFADHQTVTHKNLEFVRGEYHTNTVEGFFSVFKKGMKGVYQHCSKRHLPRYLSEFDFRYSNRSALGIEDDQRAEIALCGAVGKRLTYRQTVAT